MPEGELVTITTTTTVTSRVGQADMLTLGLDPSETNWGQIVAEVAEGETEESDPTTVEIAANPMDVSQLAEIDDGTSPVVATAGDTTTTITGTSIAVAVETTEEGEATEVEGGVGLVVGSENPQVVDER